MVPWKRQEQIAVLCHGCHLQAVLGERTWQNLVWGSDTNLPTMAGRVPMAIYVALLKGAKMVVFSTGASSKDGMVEAAYTYQFMMERIGSLADLMSKELKMRITPNELRRWIKHRVFLDAVSQNTAEETETNLARAIEANCTEVVGVTNAFHAPRCFAGLNAARVASGKSILVSVVSAYDTAPDTVILEPPHRGDRPRTNWHRLARGFFQIPEERREEFERAQQQLFERFK